MDLCWVVVGQKMEDVMDAEPPFRLLACHYLYGHVLRSFIYFQVEVKVPWWRVRLFYQVESHFLTGKNLKRLFWCGFWSVPQSLWTGGQARQGAGNNQVWDCTTDVICCSLRFYSENKKNMQQERSFVVSVRFYSENKKKGQLIPANKLTLWNKDKLQALLAPVKQLVKKRRCV